MLARSEAHEAHSGWHYPYECCSDGDGYTAIRNPGGSLTVTTEHGTVTSPRVSSTGIADSPGGHRKVAGEEFVRGLPATAVPVVPARMVPAVPVVPVPEMSVTTLTVNRTAISIHRRTRIYAGGRVHRVVFVHYPRRSYYDGPSHHDRIAYHWSLLIDCYRGRSPLFVGVDLAVICMGFAVAPVRECGRDKRRRTGYA